MYSYYYNNIIVILRKLMVQRYKNARQKTETR